MLLVAFVFLLIAYVIARGNAVVQRDETGRIPHQPYWAKRYGAHWVLVASPIWVTQQVMTRF